MTTEIRTPASDIPMGLTQVEAGEAKALVIRDADGLRAFQASCPHRGAPLAKGRIAGRKLYCPWHMAAFDIGDGALLESPAVEGLARYAVRMDGETVVVRLDQTPPVPPASSA